MANTTFSGPVTSTGGFVGDVTGAVTATTVTATGNIDCQGTANVIVIPTSDPGVAGAIWFDDPDLKISAG